MCTGPPIAWNGLADPQPRRRLPAGRPPARPSRTQGGRPVRRLVIAVLAVLTLVGLAAWPLALHSAAATRPAPKVVVIAGPVGDHNAHYQADADAIARTARKYSSNVVLIKSPRATWDRVKTAIQSASIVVYLGHGNGW